MYNWINKVFYYYSWEWCITFLTPSLVQSMSVIKISQGTDLAENPLVFIETQALLILSSVIDSIKS